MPEQMIALVPTLPWLAALWIALNRVAGRNRDVFGERATFLPTLGASVAALLILVVLDVAALRNGVPGQVRLGDWFASGNYVVGIGFAVDGLSLSLGTLTAFLSLLVVVFSVNYMHREKGFQRYFFAINLFAGAMSLIMLAGNAVLTFVGWELAGVSSYMLIGYALDRPAATANANRAFITNRIGDAGFVLSIFFAYTWIGDVEWGRINGHAGDAGTLSVLMIGAGFVIAALAKSAQVPFSPWIARALDGPTPSSAIFYGVLMVHAGVYLLLRMEPLLLEAPGIMVALVVLGLLTAFYGWVCGLVQSDVKSSLMFATTAQVGLMFVWCGLGWFQLAAWHLGLHACWRAYLFLHAPSLMFMVSRRAKAAPEWLTKSRWLYTAALQHFWIEPIGDALIAEPAIKLAQDTKVFEERVVTPLVALPSQTNAITSLHQWEGRRAGEGGAPQDEVGRGEGLAGKMVQGVASALHWFEDQMVLKGSGEGLLTSLRRVGAHLTRIEFLLSQPRYLLYLVLIVFVIVL